MNAGLRRKAMAAFGLCLVTASVWPGTAMAAKPKCADADKDWSQVEQNVWAQICIGKIADLRSEKPEQARLSNEFINDILTQDPWRKEIPVQGVRITGGIFKDFDLDNVNLDIKLELRNSWFENDARFFYVRSRRLIDLTESKFESDLDLTGTSIDSSLILRDIKVKKSLFLTNTRIDENLYLDRSYVAGIVSGLQARIGGALLLLGSRVDNRLSFREAKVDGAIKIYATKGETGSACKICRPSFKKIDFAQSRIGGDVWLRGVDADDVDFTETRIDGSVRIDESTVELESGNETFKTEFGRIDLGRAQIGGSLSLTDVEVPAVQLLGAWIKLDLVISGGSYGSIVGSYATIGGAFKLSSGSALKWKCGSELDFVNASVTSLLLDADGWPDSIRLNGLTYKAINLLNNKVPSPKPQCQIKDGKEVAGPKPENDKFVSRFCSDSESKGFKIDLCAFLRWVDLSTPPAPQPYLRLAQALKDAGYGDEANQVIVAQRELARQQASWPAWTWESIKYAVIGYGYSLEGVWILVAVFLMLGWVFIRMSKKGREEGFGIAYSFDMLLPLVKLREKHYDVELEPKIRSYFYFHRLIGYVLASFLIAALSGLTKVG